MVAWGGGGGWWHGVVGFGGWEDEEVFCGETFSVKEMICLMGREGGG